MTDIEIARSVKPKNILEIAKKLDLNEKDLVLYSDNKAKIKKKRGKKNGKLILVTASSPTPYGEGKTTLSIGLADGLNSLGKSVLACLRQPSMGPVFGIKGGATGGGMSQVIPMDEINLHFTGDFHAITSANNLLSAAIDNHIYHGNKLGIKKVLFNRCLDVNDRALRHVSLSNREEGFNITAASEIMTLFCLASDIDDLKRRLGNIIIGINENDEFIYARDLKIDGALTVILKDAILPNLVQTLEGTPAIIHGGPFANIAHGCNSLIATNLSLSLADYVVTEAGFGSDLGGEKFLDIKCKDNGLKPSAIVLTTTVRALKYNGNGSLSDGICNLRAHIENLKLYNVPIVVAINRFKDDTREEIDFIKKYVRSFDIDAIEADEYSLGSKGCLDLAKKVIDLCDVKSDFRPLYDNNESIFSKVEKVCKNIYHASNVNYSTDALEKIDIIEKNGLDKLPICIAKTQYSLSDDPKKLGYPKDFSVMVRDVKLFNGAGFITIYLGNIMTMPGLPSEPNYEKIDLVDGKIEGLF